jgi:hypothetical protein
MHVDAGNLTQNKEIKHAGSTLLGIIMELELIGARNLISAVFACHLCVPPAVIHIFCYMLVSDMLVCICREIWRHAWRAGVCTRIGINAQITVQVE